MEAERRSTMSSLKGQLSNVEGSVKSMKVAVVVGSVLTVACLAAVFGVTVLANEVSKEVKVSNGTLTSKSGKAVLTTNTVVTEKVGLGAETLFTESASFKVNAVVVNGEAKTVICDDLVAVQENGIISFVVAEESVMASILGAEESAEKRSLNLGWARSIRKWLKFNPVTMMISDTVDFAIGGAIDIVTYAKYLYDREQYRKGMESAVMTDYGNVA